MVFDYTILDGSGRVLNAGQIHVDVSPFEQAKALAVALDKLSRFVLYNLTQLPASVTIKIATKNVGR